MGHKVRTTINPDVVLNVDDAELLDLDRQGLLLSEADTKKAEARAAKAAAVDAANDKKES